MTPRAGQTYRLPSGRLVRVQREQANDSFACLYVDRDGKVVGGRELAPGCTLTGEFIQKQCGRVG